MYYTYDNFYVTKVKYIMYTVQIIELFIITMFVWFGTIPTVQYILFFCYGFWNYSDSAVSYCFSVRFWNYSDSAVSYCFSVRFWNYSDSAVSYCFSVRIWNYSDSAVYIVFLLDFWNYSDSAVSYCFSVRFLELFRQCSIILFFC